MPSKSKRNRRVNQNKGTVNSSISNISAGSPVPDAQPGKTAIIYSNNAKSDISIYTLSENFTRELKWISLVAVIMIVLLISAYFLFH